MKYGSMYSSLFVVGQCRDWRWPRIAIKDKVLHVIFVLSLITMISCAVGTILCFVTDSDEQLVSYKVGIRYVFQFHVIYHVYLALNMFSCLLRKLFNTCLFMLSNC